MRKYVIGFVLGIATTWFVAGQAAECTMPQCIIPAVANFVDVYKELPKGSRKRDEELALRTQYLCDRIALLEDKHRELCNHVYGCDPVPAN